MLLAAVALLWTSGPAARRSPQAAQAPQQPRLTFRATADYVEVDAVVTDSNGEFARGLTAADFDLREDGASQTVDAFSLVDIPFARVPETEPVLPDIITNDRDFEGRVYLLVLDSTHVAPSRSKTVRELAHQFILDDVGANDLAAVIQLPSSSAQDFTSNKRLLLSAVDRFVGNQVPSPVMAEAADPESAQDPARTLERASAARDTLFSLRSLVKYLAGLQGRRKALVLFSEGLNYDTDKVVPLREPGAVDDSKYAADVNADIAATVADATRSNVSFYTIDPRGLASAGDDTVLVGPGASRTLEMDAEIRREQGRLRTLASETGGLSVVGTNSFDTGFDQILQDNSAYYVLGYYPTNTKHDGKYRKISVKIKRPGLTVRARAGYNAPVDEPAGTPKPPAVTGVSEQVGALLTSPAQLRGTLPMRVAADALRGEAGRTRVHLVVEFAGGELPFEQDGDYAVNTIELVYVATDNGGKVQAASRKDVELRMRSDTVDVVDTRGLRITTGFDLPPGQYQVRLATRERVSGHAGSVYFDLTAPDFAKPPLAVSDLVLTSSSSAAWPTNADDSVIKGLLPAPATAERTFKLDESLAVLAEIYDNERTKPHTVDLTVTVKTTDGDQVFTTSEEREGSDISVARGGYGYVVRVPLLDMIPGRFILTVEARSSLSDEAVTRSVPFTIK